MRAGRSLKTRILLFLGGLTAVLMMVMLVSVLLRWRTLVLDTHRQKALAVAQTFASSLLDALIYQESRPLRDEEFLANHIHRFLVVNPDIKSLALYDPRGTPIFRSQLAETADLPEPFGHVSPLEEPLIRIYRSQALGWVIETTLFLRIHNREWGWLRMAFDAEPVRTQLRALFFLFYGLGVGFVLVLLGAAYLIVDRLTRSLRQLVEEMQQFDLERPLPTKLKPGDDEVGQLASSFNTLKDRLVQSRRQLLDAQRQIYHAEKLASIGRLAAGVAHEINNPLHGLKSCLFTIQEEAHNAEEVRRFASLADEAATRISNVVEKLLNFSRQKAQQRSAMDLNEVVDKALALLAYRIDKEKITIVKELDPALPTIYADAELLGQVVVNMLINSCDSMQEGGEIRISTSLSDNAHVRILIADTGCGIPEEHLDKIFDPFFTTKEDGRGTGLGLSVSLGIVEAHGGSIHVSSQVGVGTTFLVTLPIGAEP